jgi:prepilin peptidase CpaA
LEGLSKREAQTVVLGLNLEAGVVLVAVLIAAATDVWNFKIYNFLTIPLLVSGVIYHGVVGGTPEFNGSFLGALFGFGVLLTFYIMGGMGGGDVKLMAAVGAWLGMPQTFYVFIVSSLAAGCYALFLIFANGKLAETWLNFQVLWHRITAFSRYLGAEDRVEAAVSHADRSSRLIPFAAMVAIGVVATLMWGRFRGEF